MIDLAEHAGAGRRRLGLVGPPSRRPLAAPDASRCCARCGAWACRQRRTMRRAPWRSACASASAPPANRLPRCSTRCERAALRPPGQAPRPDRRTRHARFAAAGTRPAAPVPRPMTTPASAFTLRRAALLSLALACCACPALALHGQDRKQRPRRPAGRRQRTRARRLRHARGRDALRRRGGAAPGPRCRLGARAAVAVRASCPRWRG